MKLLCAFLMLAVLAPSAALAQSSLPPIPQFFGPIDPGTQAANLNSLVNKINAILVPLFPNLPGTEVNLISLGPALTGNPAVIGLQPGGDANGSIAIQPSGNGNVVLFGQGLAGQQSLSRLQFGNQSSWVSAAGLNACPGTGQGATKSIALGVGQTVTGYFLVNDWLGRPHAVAGCG